MKFSFRKMRFFKRDKQQPDGATATHGLSDDVPSYLAMGADGYNDDHGQTRSHGSRGLKGFGGKNAPKNGTANGHGLASIYVGQRQRRSSSASRGLMSPLPPNSPLPPRGGPAQALLQLPDAVLERIFAFVCPHSQDGSYEKCEDVSTDSADACMLCDMRDLAHCVQVCRRWRAAAERLLYASIRLDPVHYCEREAELADRRKRRSFFDRNAQPEDPASARLRLLCRALRDDASGRLGATVQFLKIPYMVRESCHADIARTVSLLPNLRYVDLPEGLFMDDPVYLTLKLEVQARCPALRKMTYVAGAERSLSAIASGQVWPNLEVLELDRIGMDPTTLRQVLSALPSLRALKVTEVVAGPHAFSDDVLVPTAGEFSNSPPDSSGFQQYQQQLPDIPPLEELVLTGTSSVTIYGMQEYLSRSDARLALKVLTLHDTGIKPWTLQTILSMAPALRHLTIIDEVTTTLPIAAGTTRDIRPLASASLQTINYEIKPADGVGPFSNVTRSYYNYLSGSILSGGLPNLRTVYVCDEQFPDALLLGSALPPPPGGLFGGGRPSSSGSANGSSVRASYMSGYSSSGVGPMMPPVNMMSPPASPGLRQGQGQATARQPYHQATNSFSDMDAAAFSSSVMSLAPPSKPWAPSHNPRFSSNNPFAGMISPQSVQTLEVFTKGDDDVDWSSIVVSGGNNDGIGAAPGSAGGRPSSSYGLGADMGATAGARRSVFVNAGGGNFLAVPDGAGAGGSGGSGSGRPDSRQGGGSGAGADAWPRPLSSSGEKKREKRDLWR